MNRIRLILLILLTTDWHTASPPEIASQETRGQVIDGITERPVAEALVTALQGERVVLTALTDSLGGFILDLPDAGAYELRVDRQGFVSATGFPIEVRSGVTAEVRLVIQPEVVPLGPVVATGARGRLPAAATVQGLHARRALLPRVGSNRAIVKGDPEMLSVSTVGQLLYRWLLLSSRARGRCIDWFVNGVPLSPLVAPADFVRGLPASALEGIEYYQDDTSAPLDFQGQGSCRMNFLRAGYYSIVAVWFRRE